MQKVHTIKPIYNANSKILILGSMPSVISTKENFYYANKNNRFWQIINILFKVDLKTNNEKIEFLHKNNIAMWDVIKSCDIEKSSDASIKNVKTNDIKNLLKNTNIKYIICIGNKSYQLYLKYLDKQINLPLIKLPSTSSANATYSLERLIKEFKIIKDLI